MKTIAAKLSDQLIGQLRTRATALKISEDELIARSLEEYLSKLEQWEKLEPIGFGMWKTREDMKDPVAWVRKLRETAWRR